MSKLKQNEIPLQLAKQVIVTKLKDDVFGGKHPRNINEGFQIKGTIIKDPTVGEAFYVDKLGGYFHTSTVIEIIDANTFKTQNSTYKWEVIGKSFEIPN